MVITEISRDEVLKAGREMLGLSALSESFTDDTMLAALLRRAAGILCPCSPSTLAAAVLEGLQYVISETTVVAKRLSAVTEGLIISGDLLELSQVTIDDPAVKGTWVFAAPPSFVERNSGSVFVIGIAKDEATPLPASLSERLIYEGALRVLIPEPSENLPSVLRDLGLLELSKSAWLKAPRLESATELRDGMLSRLAAQPPSGLVSDVSVLDPGRPVAYYSDRWIKPKDESGNYLARRPQAYGAPLWGLASLTDGAITKFLDFPLKGIRWRGCDAAWHLQMAIDSCRGTPQTYRRRQTQGGTWLDFFSPLPLWAQRRLAVVGRSAPPEKCLFSYWIPERELASEEAFLQERLWLAPHITSEKEGMR